MHVYRYTCICTCSYKQTLLELATSIVRQNDVTKCGEKDSGMEYYNCIVQEPYRQNTVIMIILQDVLPVSDTSMETLALRLDYM